MNIDNDIYKNYNLNELVGSTGSESGACSEIILI